MSRSYDEQFQDALSQMFNPKPRSATADGKPLFPELDQAQMSDYAKDQARIQALINAAPELFEAAKLAIDLLADYALCFDDLKRHKEVVDKIRDAIEKAKKI